MRVRRRTFLAASSGSLLGLLGLDFKAARVYADTAAVRRGTLTTSICPFCAVGCGMVLTTSAGKLVNIEGDPDHPISRGSLCSKAAALAQIGDNPRRITKVLYRPSHSTEWQERDWEWALSRIAQQVQQTRDASFQKVDPKGREVNRTEAIACLGGAALNNEECYLYGKLARALGVVYLEHQARICHASTVAALASSFGRGAMTNHWIDIANSDCVMIIGSNAAENHPIAFQWVQEARRRGATLISIDPRFTRTSAAADIYAPLRAGTDIAFVGGLIHRALETGTIHKDYLAAHTNASYLVHPEFDLDDGLFGAIQEGRYTREHWAFQRDGDGRLRTDPTLEDPHCVFQLLKRHFARYTAETVAAVCGTPVEDFRRVADAFLSTHGADRTGTILYAMGTTQHSHGTQNIRSYVILQLLLGNIGVAGGGINALRGESNVQGSTDHCLLYDMLPGYLKAPKPEDASLADYLRRCVPAAEDPQSANWWSHYPQYIVSLLKAYWGESAHAENDFAFSYLPRCDGDCSYMPLFEAVSEGKVRGMISLGQNPAVSGPDAEHQRRALERLDWLVVADLWETETAAFWKRPGADPKQIATEVFLLPAATAWEKQGSVTNSGRWAQWRWQAAEPPADARSDLWLLDRLCRRLKDLYKQGGTFPDPIARLAWDYGSGPAPDPHLVAREINGRFTAEVEAPGSGDRFRRGQPVPSFVLLRDDGSTACGNWLYCGSYTTAGNQMARREFSNSAEDTFGLHPRWAWCWPANRRILYNRAGCDPQGRPWDPTKAVTAYDWQRAKWRGDVPDGTWPPPVHPDGTPNEHGRHAFLMVPEGHARLFAPGLADGPLPEHYEPAESPIVNPLSPQQCNPLLSNWSPDLLGTPQDYPIVATTCRVTEHFLAGAVSRNLPWLVELVPNAFAEISKELARDRGIQNGDSIVIRSARGEITLYALVTGRLRPLLVAGKRVEQIAIVWHFGYQGLATGPSANVLTPRVGDADAMIPEYKAFLCDVRKGNGEPAA